MSALKLIQARVLKALSGSGEETQISYPYPRKMPYVQDGTLLWVNIKDLDLKFDGYTEHYRNGVLVKITYKLEGEAEEVSITLSDWKVAA